MTIPTGISGFANLALNAVKTQLAKYPSSSLKDIYKSFYQDAYGPGHLLADPLAARRYFDAELAQLTGHGPYGIEPCGIGHNFYRVDLGLVTEGRVDAEVFFTRFLQSMVDLAVPEVALWSRQWYEVLGSLEPVSHLIQNFEQDAKEIAGMLEQGKLEMRHSERYHRLYDPHYRIIRWEYAKLLLIQ